jgi:hypothetical protein
VLQYFFRSLNHDADLTQHGGDNCWLLTQSKIGNRSLTPFRVLSQLKGLLSSGRQRTDPERKALEREVGYFRSHRDHLNYQEREREGHPGEAVQSSPSASNFRPGCAVAGSSGDSGAFRCRFDFVSR